jgi:hypothetical protein
MAGDFSEVESKLRWARHQLTVLQLELTDYLDLDPFVAIVEDDPEEERYRFIANLRYPPPASLAHTVGDVLSNLHGVLDYLAWQLVLREGQTPDRETSFPIIRAAREGVPEPEVNIYRSREGRARGRVAMITDKTVLALLRDVQPYRDGDRADFHPLQVLRTLNGESKHRHPVVLASASGQSSVVSGAEKPESLAGSGVVRFTTGRYVNDGEEVFSIPYAEAPNGCGPNQATFTVQVSLEGAPKEAGAAPSEILSTAGEIYTFIAERIVSPLRLLF